MEHKLINLTGKDIQTDAYTYPSDGKAEYKIRTETIGVVNYVMLVRKKLVSHNLPPSQPGVWLIVDEQLRILMPDRKDLVSIGDPYITESGYQMGCRNLIAN